LIALIIFHQGKIMSIAPTISIILFIAIALVLVILFILISKQTQKIVNIEQKQNNLSLLCENLQQVITQYIDNNQQPNIIEELTQKVTQQQSTTATKLATIDQQISDATEQITTLANEVDILINQQPEDKLYSRALKLAELGAGVEEISESCEIPIAEAEMLLAVHKKK
jgi:type II secretory pathway pseudopilin PulG